MAHDEERALRAQWTAKGVLETDLVLDDEGTISATYPAVEMYVWSAHLESLPEIQTARGPLVELFGEIGRGGMGVVRRARQRSLGRNVAAKSTVGGSDASREVEALLREAWICGHLEHPNIIPVYELYRREGDEPLMLMKHIEGSPWSEVLQRSDDVEAQLRHLVQLCHAVHYAHTHGVVHLDLKPENVMIGSFGEMYLLDWGVAASTSDAHPDFIPRAEDIEKVLGTPSYMAPELAEGDGASIGPATDVYLLGAVLHEILTGQPPHQGETLMDCVVAAYTSAPTAWPEDLPEELTAIASRAMAREAPRRYASAAQMREALEGYLVHSDSLTLAAAARERLGELARHEGDDFDRLASEAEFGFRQALHVWEGNERAREGLQELIERLIEADLAKGSWRAALRRLGRLPEARPELERQIEALRETADLHARELKQRRDDVDLGRAARQRSVMAAVGAFGWTFALVGLGLLDTFEVLRVGNTHLLAVTSGAAVIFLSLVYWGRRQLFANAINRRLVGLLGLGWLFGVVYWVGAWAVDAPFREAVVGIVPLICFVPTAGAVTVDKRLMPMAVVAIIGSIIHPFFADYGLEILGAVGGAVLLMLSWTWRRSPDDAAGPSI